MRIRAVLKEMFLTAVTLVTAVAVLVSVGFPQLTRAFWMALAGTP